jgi:hypothetical protein
MAAVGTISPHEAGMMFPPPFSVPMWCSSSTNRRKGDLR